LVAVSPADAADDRSDGDLLDIVIGGGSDRSGAWGVLVARHSGKMYAVARAFALDAATGEDLVQTAWLRLLERAHQLRDHTLLGPWLCTIVRNEARKLVTRRRTVPVADGFDRRPDPSEPPEGGLLARERAAALRLAFSRLSDDCRQLLRLVTAEPPLSYDEVAAAVGRPRGSLGPTRQRCLEHLRRQLPAGFVA
jgi:RNA polymerase sigma factor (sigma-70 family)